MSRAQRDRLEALDAEVRALEQANLVPIDQNPALLEAVGKRRAWLERCERLEAQVEPTWKARRRFEWLQVGLTFVAGLAAGAPLAFFMVLDHRFSTTPYELLSGVGPGALAWTFSALMKRSMERREGARHMLR